MDEPIIIMFQDDGEAWTLTPVTDEQEKVLDKIVEHSEKRKAWCG